jgi:hypothetical protein
MLASLDRKRREHYTQQFAYIYAQEKFNSAETKVNDEVEEVAQKVENDAGTQVAKTAKVFEDRPLTEKVEKTKKDNIAEAQRSKELTKEQLEAIASLMSDIKTETAIMVGEVAAENKRAEDTASGLKGTWGGVTDAQGTADAINGPYKENEDWYDMGGGN